MVLLSFPAVITSHHNGVGLLKWLDVWRLRRQRFLSVRTAGAWWHQRVWFTEAHPYKGPPAWAWLPSPRRNFWCVWESLKLELPWNSGFLSLGPCDVWDKTTQAVCCALEGGERCVSVCRVAVASSAWVVNMTNVCWHCHLSWGVQSHPGWKVLCDSLFAGRVCVCVCV